MKFHCGKKKDEIDASLSEWHIVFALLPKKVGLHDCRWLEWIERKGTKQECWEGGFYWIWEYRALT